jgi:hypothetical protein
MKHRLLSIIAGSLIVAAGLSACSTAGEDPGGTGTATARPSVGSTSSKPSPSKVVKCMDRHGLTTTYSKLDRSFSSRTSGKISTAKASAVFSACKIDAGYRTITVFSKAEKIYLYKKTSTLTNCLVNHGHKMPTMPTEKEFVASYQNHPFLPYAYLPKLSERQFKAIEKQCPQPFLG